MVSPTDEDLERLRAEHNLDLSNVKTIEDLKRALQDTSPKFSSGHSLGQQLNTSNLLVRYARSWFGLDKVQEAVEDNNISIIESFTTLQELRKYDLPSDINSFTESNIVDAFNEKEAELQSEAEDLAKIIKSPSSLDEYERVVEELRTIDPRKLGGLKTQDILKGRRALKILFS